MMASDCEASCESDPNFAIICAFMEKFGETCGIDKIDFVELQMMLENNQEVSQKLIDLHIKLLRKTKKNVTPERWERALVNMCHIFSSKDAWEIERFGYKKTKLSIKIRALKELLEMQFDYNTKFKNDVNKIAAEELRSQPLGRDKLGRAYWLHTNENYQMRIYKEDPDEETWKLIAKDREGLISLISELTDPDSKLSSDSACNEDSNSLLEKPFIDTGQNENSNECKTKDKDKCFLGDQSSSNSRSNDDIKVDNENVKEISKDDQVSALSTFKFESKSTDSESPDAKKPKLELSEEIESPEVITKGVGSGVDNENANFKNEPLIIGEEIEEPLMHFYGDGSGVDCGTGNEKDDGDKEKNDGGSHVGGFKLGTIIDKKVENRILSPKDPNRKSRWDQKETQVQEKTGECGETTQTPKKMTFFFGPGSLNVKPNTSLTIDKPNKDSDNNSANSTTDNEQSIKNDDENKEEQLHQKPDISEKPEEKVPSESLNKPNAEKELENVGNETRIQDNSDSKSQHVSEPVKEESLKETHTEIIPNSVKTIEEPKNENNEVPPSEKTEQILNENIEPSKETEVSETNDKLVEMKKIPNLIDETSEDLKFPLITKESKKEGHSENQPNILQAKPEEAEEKAFQSLPEQVEANQSSPKKLKIGKVEEAKEENIRSSPKKMKTEKVEEPTDSLTTKTENLCEETKPENEKEKIIENNEATSSDHVNLVTASDAESSNDDRFDNDPIPNVSEEEEKEDDPKTHASITNFTFDYDPNSPSAQSDVITRNLRKRGREVMESKPDVGETTEKKPKMRGKRTIDVSLRKSIEEKRQQDVSSDESGSSRKDSKGKASKKTPPKKQGNVAPVTDSDETSQKSDEKPKKPNKSKRILKNLGIREEDIQSISESPVPVRQSRRLAQLKIQQEAIRRKMDDDEMDTKKKKKKDDKDYKAGKRKRTEEEVKSAPTPPIEKKKHKKKKKDKISIGWNTSSEDSDYTGKEEEDGSEYEYEEHNDDVLEFKSDHEFSPESDLEGDELLPLKRARTARKEESDDEDADEEFPCQKCGKSDHPEWILLCDNCDNGWHCSCLRPALFVIPEGDWYCPSCQHETLLKKLQEKLREFDKMMVKKEMEDRRKERLAYVGISLNNVLPAKEKKRRNTGSDISSEAESASESASESKSESAKSSDSDEPIYQLRQRRQAHSYKFQDYDDMINSALQEEPLATVKKTHTQGRGKDIATIVNAAKEEEEKNSETVFEDLPPVVPKETSISIKKKTNSYRRKPKRLNNLEMNSDDDADDSDEDFKGSSSNYSDEEDFEEDSDDSFIARKGSKASRRSTRARQKRFDEDFINDDSDDDSDIIPSRKKRRAFVDDDSESDVSESWGRKKKKTSNKKSKKKKSYDESDTEIYKKKKSKHFTMESDDIYRGRRTRGKKTSYVLDELGSESEEEEIVVKKTKKESDDDEEYVAEEEEEKELEDEEEEEEVENDDVSEENDEPSPIPDTEEEEENSDSKDEPLQIIKKIKIAKKTTKRESVKKVERNPELDAILSKTIDDIKELDKQDLENQPGVIVPVLSVDRLKESESLNGNSQVKEIDDNLPRQPEVIPFKNEQENPLKNVRTNRFFNKSSQMNTLTSVNNDDNDELSEPPGVGLPLFTEFGSNSMPENLPTVLPLAIQQLSHPQLNTSNLMALSNPISYPSRPIQPLEAQTTISPPSGDSLNNISPEGTPRKRRGRGKGKKTLAAEAAAAAAATTGTTTSIISASGTLPTISNKPLVANIEIASPPQPFSQSQPTPSVITRMLQTAPCKPSYPVGRIRPKQFAMIGDGEGVETTEAHGDGAAKELIQGPPGHYGAPISGPYPANFYPKDGQPSHHYLHPQQGPPIHSFSSHSVRPTHDQPLINPPPAIRLAGSTSPPIGQYTGPPQAVTHRQTYPNPHSNYDYDYNAAPPPNVSTDEGLPQPAYEQPYPEHFETSRSPNTKNADDEPAGEFGGLVSYFSSQREDDLDS